MHIFYINWPFLNSLPIRAGINFGNFQDFVQILNYVEILRTRANTKQHPSDHQLMNHFGLNNFQLEPKQQFEIHQWTIRRIPSDIRHRVDTASTKADNTFVDDVPNAIRCQGKIGKSFIFLGDVNGTRLSRFRYGAVCFCFRKSFLWFVFLCLASYLSLDSDSFWCGSGAKTLSCVPGKVVLIGSLYTFEKFYVAELILEGFQCWKVERKKDFSVRIKNYEWIT